MENEENLAEGKTKIKKKQNYNIAYWNILLIGVLCIIFGAADKVFGTLSNRDDWVILIIVGFILLLFVVYENYKYKKTGKVLFDERTNLNILKASRNGFLFLVISQAIILILLLDIWKVAELGILSGLVLVTWGLGMLIYALSHYAYERGVEEKKVSLISTGVGILGIATVIFGVWFISQFDFNQTTEIYDVIMAEKLENGKPVAEKTEFGKDAEIIYACANVTSTPFESGLYVRWYDIYGVLKVLEDKAVIDCVSNCWQCFNITKPADGWRPGEYVAEFCFDFDYLEINRRANYTKFKII